MGWYKKIVDSKMELLPEMIKYYEDELIENRKTLKIKGSLEKLLSELPGITEKVFSELQDLEMIVEFLNLQLRKIQQSQFQKYLETYNKALSSRDAEKYANSSLEVTEFELIIHEVSLVRNEYLGVIKGLENKNYNIGSISRLRVAGLENANIE